MASVDSFSFFATLGDFDDRIDRLVCENGVGSFE
jgi:hypothetical protein